MSYRSLFILGDDAWPGLQFNPAKGDLEAIDDLASDVKAVSAELDELDKLLESVGKNGGAWEGEAAERFSEKLGKLPKYLKQGADSMGDCAKALRSWHTQLSSFQRKAENLESEAVTARREADRLAKAYNSESDRLLALGPMPADEADRLTKKLDQQRAEVDQAQDKLKKLIREAEEIYGRWNDRAQEAEAAIIKASENHPPDFGFWERVGDGLKEIARDAGDWLAENADLLSTISSGLSAAALACQIIPGVGTAVGGVLGAAAGAFALGAMAGHALQGMRGQKGGWVKMGLDAFAVLPGAAGAKALVTAGKGARLTSGREALETGLHSGLLQRKVIQPAELGIAKRFGKELTGDQITKMNQYSQLTLKSGATAFGVSKEANK
ncbi:hypothetical protein H181DRAFT_05274 [Streptomyces sp. WMMB 714]|uniref:putative T7SS-secreted protein n=1 Tax=Streptomyces sp. WMMB 714 TaxID=1286822 RepID=UPI0005F7935C|nr:hypothetical protein [Streptomyces sp. WMMB 714]SCK56611.1 hypothetical protein H181DRAFT_05274 [Streptomyces sp. WMMB 714]